MHPLRRPVFALLGVLLALVAACGGPPAQAPAGRSTTITDVLGRQVTVPVPATRILAGGARLLYTTAILSPDDPAAGIVGWPDDLKQNDPDTWQRYLARFPHMADIPVTGEVYDGSMSAEQALQLRPDVFVVSASVFPAAQDAGIVGKLEAAGIPTVVIDYFVDPLKNSARSVEILGQLTGHEDRAAAYTAYYRAGVDAVTSRLAAAHPTPTPTFLWRAPGYFDCCSTFARSNLAQLVAAAGGANLGDALLSTQQGTLSPETVLAHDPAVVIATGADWAPGTPAAAGTFVALGYDEPPARASEQLAGIIGRQPGFAELTAVRTHRTHAVWHHFYDSPYNVLALQWFATWLHPDLFADVDPAASMRELHERFLPVAAGGAFSAELP